MIRSVPFAIFVVSACAGAQAQQPPLPESPGSSIGYPSVAAALEGVKGNAAIKLSTQGGWTLGVDDAASIFWAFPPPGNPAYPSAVKRHIIEKKDGVYITMDVACEATKAACDKLVRDFQALNAAVKERFSPKR